ncbi:MAG: TetR/AcrR family transcriptional regulator [Hyphomonadaceae bacterium]|nr:TetR/AcrR family transcriptional regulator [Hyphomonadaceae bacterium]
MKRKALLREAARAFNAKGYHDTSLADVAKTLGVTKTALYYYVKSKEEILFECHLLSLELGDQAIAFANEFGRNGREKVKLLARKYLELMMSEIGSPAVLVEVNALSDANRKRIAHRRDAFEQYFRGLVRKGITDGSLRDVDPKLLVFYFMGAVNWLSLWFRPTGEYSGNHIADEFSKLLDEAIGRASACSQMRTGKGGRATRERG